MTTDAAASAMSDPEAYRLKLPDEPDGPSEKSDSDIAEFYDEMLDYGRSRSKKVTAFSRLMGNWNQTDVYYLLRLFTDKRFVHPMTNLDLGTNIVHRAVAKAFYGGNETEVDHFADEAGSVTRHLRNEYEVPVEVNSDWTVLDLYDELRALSEMGGQQEQVDRIVKVISTMRAPWVFTFWLLKDLSFYVGEYQMRKAMVETYHDVDSDTANKAQEINDDVPSLFCYYHDEGYLRTTLEAHDRIGNMKAKGFDAEDVASIDAENWVAQTKYDGVRIYIHHDGDGDLRAYGSGKRDMTAALPELQEIDWPDCAFIFDGEATPYDAETGEVKSFQQILRRTGRRPDETLDADVTDGLEVKFKLFDCPLWHGKDIRQRPFEDRFSVVQTVFAPPMVARQGTDLEACFHRSVEEGHEGVVLKRLGHPYQAGNRSGDWRKWKAAPKEIDVIITDARRGSGRISDRMGAMGIALEHDGELVNVGSVGTGFSDDDRLRLWRKHEAGELEGSVCQLNFEEFQNGRDDSEIESSWALRFPSFDALRPEGEVDTLAHAANLDGKSEEFDAWCDKLEDAKRKKEDESMGELFG